MYSEVYTEVYSEPSQISVMEELLCVCVAKIFNGFSDY